MEGGREHLEKLQYCETRKKALSWSEVVFLELLKNRLSISQNSTEEIGKFALILNVCLLLEEHEQQGADALWP